MLTLLNFLRRRPARQEHCEQNNCEFVDSDAKNRPTRVNDLAAIVMATVATLVVATLVGLSITWGVYALQSSNCAQPFCIGWGSVDSGGGMAAGGDFAITGSVGQPDAQGGAAGGDFTLHGGFMAVRKVQSNPPTITPTGIANITPTVTPAITPTPTHTPTGVTNGSPTVTTVTTNTPAAPQTPGPVHLPIILAQPTSTSTNTPLPVWRNLSNSIKLAEVAALAIKDNVLFVGDRSDHKNANGGLYKANLSTCTGALFFETVSRGRPVHDIEFSGTLGLAARYEGKVYVTTNGGIDWVDRAIPQSDSQVRSVAFAGTVSYAGTELNGLYQSFDNGVNWQLLNERPKNINVVTAQNASIWVGTNAGIGPNDPGGVWEISGGSLIEHNQGLISDASRNVFDIVYNQNEARYYLATSDGLYRGTGLSTWEKRDKGNKQLLTLMFIGDELYAGTRGDGVLRLDANSAEWQPVESTGWDPKATVRDLLYDPTHCQGLLAATDNGVWLYK